MTDENMITALDFLDSLIYSLDDYISENDFNVEELHRLKVGRDKMRSSYLAVFPVIYKRYEKKIAV